MSFSDSHEINIAVEKSGHLYITDRNVNLYYHKREFYDGFSKIKQRTTM